MATLIANADGNLTGSSTFAAAETGANALAMIRNSTTSFVAAGTSTSSTFTVTNGSVIDAVLLWLYAATGATGTIKVDLQKGGVSQGSVTINKADLPYPLDSSPIPMPVLFKLGASATGDGGSNWTIVVTTTGTGTVTYYRATSTTANFTRALRTTTAAAPAAGDDLFIIGELTGAGTHNARVVTMDSITATAYGNGSVNSTSVAGGLLAISNYGTLSYGTSAATNYVLRLAGDLIVYQYGTLNIGSSGSEIPRDSTAVLEFQPVSANGDFGLQNRNGTVNIAGLSRTSGKNVVKCKLTADVGGGNFVPVTANASQGTLTTGQQGVTGTSLMASAFAENTANNTHTAQYVAGSTVPGSTTQVAQVWLARGSGTHNRYVRVALANSLNNTGVYTDVDLQAGTAGACTAFGSGSAGSASIVALGNGYLVTISGQISTASQTPYLWMLACSAAGTTSYLGDGTQCFIFQNGTVYNSPAPSTTYNVDADTGWLNGDVVCIASTNRTASECEIALLSANAGASSITSAFEPFAAHSGTSPTQAEVGLLTRNVKIRSTNPLLKTYLYCTAAAVLNMSWAELYYIGVASTVTKRGIEIDTGATVGAKSITYCSLHDSNAELFYGNGTAASINLTFSHNILWNAGGSAFRLASTAYTDYVIDDNLNIFPSGSGFVIASMGGVITNNTVVGCVSVNWGFSLSVSTGVSQIGTFQNNTAHSCGGAGMLYSIPNASGVIDGFVAWRNNNYGIQTGSVNTMAGVKFTNLTLFGSTQQFLVNTDVLNISNAVLCGDTSFSSSYAFYCQSSTLTQFNFDNVDTNPGTGIYTTNTIADFVFTTYVTKIEAFLNNCNFGAPNLISTTSGKNFWLPDSFMSFQRYNQTNGDHRTEMTYGQLKTDTTIYNTAAPSMRMTPSDVVNKLESAPPQRGILVPVINGAAMNVSVYVRKSVSGDGAAYGGNQPRLIQRANPALGQNDDVVLATASGAAGSWEQLTGTTSVATDDGAWEIVVDCDGTVGWINVDDFDWSA